MYTKSNNSIPLNSKLSSLRKPSSSNKIISVKENEKPSQIVANNIVYNNSKIPNNYNSNASAIPRESSINFNRLIDRDDSKLLRENKELKEENYALKKKNLDKDKQLREKEGSIKELQERIHKLELENNRAKDKINKIQRNIRRPTDIANMAKTEDEELALALEKINDMEARRGINENNHIHNHIFRNNHDRHNPFGINIDPTDIININSSSSNRLFNEFFESFGPNIDRRDNFLHTEEYHPLDEYERQIVEELCPNPDNMTYEQLLELQEQVGNVAKGFTRSELEKIPTFKFNKAINKNIEKCTVCQYDYNQNEILRKLTCGHAYHKQCIDEWLLNDKKCAICKMEVAIFK